MFLNNNNTNDDNSPHCFVNWTWKWDASWACTRWIWSYKHVRCNTEFPEFYVFVSSFILVSLPPVLLLSASIPKPQQTSSPVVLVIWCKYTPNVLFIFYFCWHWRVLFMLCDACNNRTVLTHRTASKKRDYINPPPPSCCLSGSFVLFHMDFYFSI